MWGIVWFCGKRSGRIGLCSNRLPGRDTAMWPSWAGLPIGERLSGSFARRNSGGWTDFSEGGRCRHSLLLFMWHHLL